MYYKNLDASRFFAFLFVFPAHCFISSDEAVLNSELFRFFYERGKTGLLGLEYFFVLSAFLITSIILREVGENGKLNVKNFLIRRTLRVWPLYYLMIAAAFTIAIVSSAMGMDISPLPEWPWLFFFAINHYIILHGQEFLFFIVFLWSISVEEQFYVFWSMTMKFIHRHLIPLSFILVIISLVYRVIYISDSARLYFHAVSALGNFGVGALLAALVHGKGKLYDRLTGLSLSANTLVYSILILSIIFFRDLMHFETFVVVSRLYFSLLFAFVILNQCLGKNLPFGFGNWKPANYMGKISYGLYCYHGLVITILSKILPLVFKEQSAIHALLLFPAIILTGTIFVSHLSYRYFELRFLNLKKRFYNFNP